jgi:glycosyltransferase involved in cell wall biosynthesis
VPLKRTKPLLIFSIVFVLAALIQLVYFTVFLIAFQRRKLAVSPENVPVSIIVCAHDEEENLKELVPILLSQDYDRFEVVVVNDRSNDHTYDFLLDATKKDSRLKMVNVWDKPEHVNGKKFALTLGIRAAANEWILLTDADCRPRSNNWIRAMSQQFAEDAQFVIGFSPYSETRGFLNSFIRFESLITALQYLSFALVKNPYMGVGRNLAYRKSLFLEKKGFNNFLHVTGGDDDLFVNQHANGKNTRAQLSPESLVVSIPENSWSEFFYQKIRHLSVGRRYRFKHKFLLGMFMITWVITLFEGLPLLAFSPYYYVIVGALLIRWILMISAIRKLVKKTGLTFNFWIIPILDFLYPIYYISTALVTLFSKKVRWKK